MILDVPVRSAVIGGFVGYADMCLEAFAFRGLQLDFFVGARPPCRGCRGSQTKSVRAPL